MTTTKNFSKFLIELTNISPRRGKGEQQAAVVIKDFLENEKIPYLVQEFTSKIPVAKKAELKVDGKDVPCLGASFVSGSITKDAKVLNTFGAMAEKEMIVFSPVSEGICLQSYKHVPTLAINRDSVVDLVMGKEVSGKVEVEEFEFTSQNILVGNTHNPKRIIFAHYDSIIGAGALDNAAAVEAVFNTIVLNKFLIKDNLFVFAGSEEESLSSYEGCYGFEVFDKKYKGLMNQAKEIIVPDGIGIGKPSYVKSHISWVFAISRLSDVIKKVLWLQNDQFLIMKYYHTKLDTLAILEPKFIKQAEKLLVSKLSED